MTENIERLTQLQYSALEGEIAFALATSPHDAEMKYRIYMTLKSLSPKIKPYVIESIKNNTTLDESEIDRIILEVGNDTVPVWLWTDRAIADIKLILSNGLENNPLSCKLSVNRKKSKESLVKSAFVMFVRNSAIICPMSTKKLCYEVMEDLDLKFLYSTCFMLLKEIEELEEHRPSKSLPNPTILDISFDVKDIMSFKIELESVEHISESFKSAKPPVKRKGSKTKQVLVKDMEEQLKSDEFSSEEISQFISEKLEELFTGQVPKPNTKKKSTSTVFKVQKTYNGSNLSTTLKVFKTEQEAVDFVKNIEKDYPELKQTCRIEIFKETEQ